MAWLADLQEFGLVVLAGVLGAAIGFERQVCDKPAGLRTHFFVGAGSAMLILLGEAVATSYTNSPDLKVQSDPIRVIQAIVVGISFLGAGTIIHRGGRNIEGLTTAASIFLTAGIGIAVAVEKYVMAVGTTALAVLVLTLLGRIEKRFGVLNQNSDDEPQ